MTMINVIKRDNTKVQFDKQKITSAIGKAYQEVYPSLSMKSIKDDAAKRISSEVCDIISVKYPQNVSVEDIQDMIEKKLMEHDKDVAKAYITYRYKRQLARDKYKELMNCVDEKIGAKNIKYQNANVDESSFGGRRGEAASALMKQYAFDYCMSETSKKHHLNNEIYIHDLDSYAVGMHNCLSIPFDDLLESGFNTRQTDVRPAQSVGTAFQLVAVIFQLQSLQQFGGVAATHLDWTMMPYVRKSFLKHYITAWLKDNDRFLDLDLINMIFNDYTEEVEGHIITRNEFDDWVDSYKSEFFKVTNTTEKDYRLDNENLNKKYYQSALYDTIVETKQAVEGMYHNLNTLQSRSGNQLPFTSINYGTCTTTEGRLVTRCLIETSIKGIGKLHKTPIFPCGIFQYMKGVNDKPCTPNYDLYRLALKSTSLRLYPNYVNVDWSNNKGYDINDPRTYMSTMGCRTANLFDINGLGQLKDGRGNICPVTIILPTIAMQAKQVMSDVMNGRYRIEIEVHTNKGNVTITSDDGVFPDLNSIFMALLDQKIGEAKDMLLERFEWICSQSSDSAKFMYENNLMAGYVPEEGIWSALKHGTLAIGQLGLAETLQILIGVDHTTDKGMVLAKDIEKLFQTKCAEFKEQYKLNFGVYYTPAENLCFTAMKKFKDKYGEIPNVSDKDYFTNSMHVPVWRDINPFEKIDVESQLTGYSSAGCITYVELPSSAKHNIDALETLVNYAMDKDIPYFAINVPNDTCLNCGYTDEINNTCPKCGSTNIQRLRRVTGYLTGNYTTAFNLGKQQEVEMRVKHIK